MKKGLPTADEIRKNLIFNNVQRKQVLEMGSPKTLKEDKAFVMNSIKAEPSTFKFACAKFRDDDEIARLAISLLSFNIVHTSLRFLRANKSLIEQCAKAQPELISKLSNEFKTKAMLKASVADVPAIIRFFPQEMITKDIAYNSIKNHNIAMGLLPREYIHDADFLINAYKINPSVEDYFPSLFSTNEEFKNIILQIKQQRS